MKINKQLRKECKIGNDMLFAEFLFYNKSQNLIDDSIIQSIKQKLIDVNQEFYWTDTFYSDAGIGFKFYTTYNIKDNTKIEIYVEMLNFHTPLDKEKFLNATQMIKNIILNFELTQEQEDTIIQLNLYDYAYDTFFNTKSIYYCNSWETLLNLFITNGFINKFKSVNLEDYIKKNTLLFNYNEEIKDKIDYISGYHGYNKFEKLYFIYDVIEKRINDINYRIALIHELDRYGGNFKHKVFPQDDRDYNFIDKNRIYFVTHNHNYFLDLNTNEINSNNSIIVYEKLISIISDNIHELLSNNEYIVNAKIYNFFKQRVDKFGTSSNSYTKKDLDLLTLKYKELLEKDKTIKIQNLFISNKEIYNEDKSFYIEFKKDFMITSDKISDIRTALNKLNTQYNINEFYENILKISNLEILNRSNIKESDYKDFKGIQYTLNGVNIHITKDNNRLYINDIFCRIDDIYYMLSRAICYNTQKDYNKYLSDVSHIGADWLHMISQGIEIQLNNPFMEIFKQSGMKVSTNNKIRFSLLWDVDKKNNVYLVVNGQKHLIKYKQKFKQEYYNPSTHTSLSALKTKLSESIANLDDDLVVSIVDNALKEAIIVQSRGIELVRDTVKGVQAEDCILQIENNNLDGYKLKGRVSGSDYFIQKHTLNVFKLNNGKWDRRCVVDDYSKQRIYEDKLANRLINIYNEPLKIHTIHR